jgi:dolichol-phosphate mannosyltransferase
MISTPRLGRLSVAVDASFREVSVRLPPVTPESKPRRVLLVLPAYNEAPNIAGLLARIRCSLNRAQLEYKIILIDDCSTDETAALIQQHGESGELISSRHDVNQGLGTTLRDGLLMALSLSSESDIIVTMDADGTHDPALVPRMVNSIALGNDVVIASRFRPGSMVRGVPVVRKVLSVAASCLFRILFPVEGIRDYTSGFRAYRVAALQRALQLYETDGLFSQRGFQCMVDILLKLRSLQLRFSEVPLVLRYDLKGGASKMRVGRTIVDTLVVAARHKSGTP